MLETYLFYKLLFMRIYIIFDKLNTQFYGKALLYLHQKYPCKKMVKNF